MFERVDTCLDSDEALMRRYRSTLDANVFERLVERYWARGFGVAVRLLRDRHAAEDALQEAFLRLLRHADRYDCALPFASWFYVILRNTCLDMRRRHQSEVRLAEHDSAGVGRPAMDEGGEGELLKRLSGADRDVLVLRIVQRMSFADIAVALGCSEEAARKRAQRALRRLRRQLVPAGMLEV